jgi:hypothetical protein
MVATFTSFQAGVTFASSKHMLSIFNGAGSGRVLRVYRAVVLNNQTAAVTGVMTTFELRRSSAQSGGTAVTPIKHDTSSSNLPAQVLSAQGATVTAAAADVFRRVFWSNDEPATGTGTNDELECIVPLMYVWDAGYGDTNVEPITLREGQGLTLLHTGTSAVGNCDIGFEFTDSAT